MSILYYTKEQGTNFSADKLTGLVKFVSYHLVKNLKNTFR